MRAQKQLRDVSSSATGTDRTTRARVASGTRSAGGTSAEQAERLLADVRALAPEITARAAEIEAGRRIPPDLVEALKSIGVFRMFVPRSHGGLELDLPDALEVLSALARIEGSVGWTVAIASGSQIFTAMLPPDAYERIYGNGPDAMIAGSIQPVGTAAAAPGGWQVNGRWPFASGCQHADWLGAFCIMQEGGKPLLGEDGAPVIRGFFLPAGDWQIEDTWYAAGLKGTGSHHITLKDTVVPAENFFDFWGGTPCLPGPLYQAAPQLLPLIHGSVSFGIAEGALDDLVAHANTGRQQFRAAAPMRESETFQFELGRVAADVRAARAFLQVQAESHWRHALAGTLKTEALHAESTQTAVWLATTCTRAADQFFTLAGASAVFESSPLQRRMRDLHVASQHAAAHQRHYAAVGKLLLDSSLGGRATPAV
jgi:alkylation response protein AidB-like acyl-CoA dehydrogenase